MHTDKRHETAHKQAERHTYVRVYSAMQVMYALYVM